MVQSFDWIRDAANDSELKNQILECMNGEDNELELYGKFVITFHNDKGYLIIDRATDEFVKVIKTMIPYDVLCRMLEGDWEDCTGIQYLD